MIRLVPFESVWDFNIRQRFFPVILLPTALHKKEAWSTLHGSAQSFINSNMHQYFIMLCFVFKILEKVTVSFLTMYNFENLKSKDECNFWSLWSFPLIMILCGILKCQFELLYESNFQFINSSWHLGSINCSHNSFKLPHQLPFCP